MSSYHTLCRKQSHAGFLRDVNTSASVIEIINLLDEVLGAKTFNSLFPVILTDNGSEFSNPKGNQKTLAPFHAIEQRYFIVIQVLPYQKEPVKSTMNWYVVSCQKEAVSMSWHNRILLWWWTISILIKEKSWTKQLYPIKKGMDSPNTKISRELISGCRTQIYCWTYYIIS